MRMLNGNILVTEIEKINKTESGIYLVGDNEKESFKEVIVVEPDKDDIVKVGDKLKIHERSGMFTEIDKQDYLIINVRDIILICD